MNRIAIATAATLAGWFVPLCAGCGAAPEPPPKPVDAPAADTDGDGVPDAADRCTAEAEDVDRFEDGDGCPDPDTATGH